MHILFRYIFREVIASSLIGTVLFTFVLFLKSVGLLMSLLIHPSGSVAEVIYLFLLAVPQVLRFTIPIGVLIGVLVGLGRISSDGEITAMRAAGIPGLRLVKPVALVALIGGSICAVTTLYYNPLALQKQKEIAESLKISQASAEVQPRVFIETFPDTVLYVRDVVPGPVVRWKGIFIADERTPESRGSFGGSNAAVDGPRITVAEEAVVVPRPEQDRLQLRLPHASTYEQSHDAVQYHSFEFQESDQVLQSNATAPELRKRTFEQTSTAQLISRTQIGEKKVDAEIELHQRFSLPFACFVLPMVGVPIAISSRRLGKSAGVVSGLILVFLYYMVQLSGIALAKAELLATGPSIWIANLIFVSVGIWLLSQLDAPNRRDFTATVGSWLVGSLTWSRKNNEQTARAQGNFTRNRKRTSYSPMTSESVLPGFRIIDWYVLRTFLFYLLVLVTSFVAIWFVFSFFELLSDMLEREKLGLFIPYVYYLTPFLVYETAPLCVLVGTLVCFGVLAKYQELTAFKACGVGLYRLAAPILVTATAISGLLFALDYYYLPEMNRKQDAIRDEIKGRPVRTFLKPDRRWMFGKGERIYHHRFFDSQEKAFAKINVYDFDEQSFRLERHIAAERAYWDTLEEAWIFENGWVREIDGNRVLQFSKFNRQPFSDLSEEPSYFLKEERQHQQMNWRELHAYITDLTQSGFDTVRLQVQWHKKMAFPLFAVSMAVLAIPFSLVAGHRGALTGVALSIGLAIAYYSLNGLLEQLGRAGQLSPAVAAWAPGVIFGLVGLYLFLRVRS
ncbi:MAG: LPS export ABC transporter permease LptF [Solibacterales bacterium]|nr:LPS export ABC transporter permease LptF [Bryobacterales bacterium]